MEKKYTILFIPNQQKGPISFHISKVYLKLAIVLFAVMSLVGGIFLYDYYEVIQQVQEHKGLTIENRKLKNQLQIFQVQLDKIGRDLHRMTIFEDKLRTLTGLENTQSFLKGVEESNRKAQQLNGNALDSFESKKKTSLIKVKGPRPFYLMQGDQRRQALFKDKSFNATLKLYENNLSKTFKRELYGISAGTWANIMHKYKTLSFSFAHFDYQLKKISQGLFGLESRIHAIDQFLLDQESLLRSTPTLMPAEGWITSYFGPRYSHYSSKIKMHEGIDIGAPIGRKIVAPADGIVTYSGTRPGFGNFVQISHGYGLETIYGHAHSLAVHYGQRVSRGTVLGTVGNTGFSTGPHLHYEVRVNGIAVDPLYFILN